MRFKIAYFIRMSFVCLSYVLVCYPYVTCIYQYVVPMSLVCTRTPSVCHSYVFVCHPYVTRMYSYFIRMSLVCTRMSLVCTRVYSYVIRMQLVCGFTMNHKELYFLQVSLTDSEIRHKYISKKIFKIKSNVCILGNVYTLFHVV